MKEITRIHLAKVPYNIELEAKRLLEKYLRDLQAYAGASDIVEDVEARMTELLAERQVEPDGTITLEDVEALQKQLGSPEAFGDNEEGSDQLPPMPGRRRLFRDPSHGYIGGVAAGVAAYFGLPPILVRIVLIVLALASFGSMLFVYAALWVILPPVKSPSDSLQLEGRPITLAALRELGDTTYDAYKKREHRIARAGTVVLGLGFMAAVIGTLIACTWVAYMVFVRHDFFGSGLRGYVDLTTGYVSVGLLLASGLLFATLMTVGAFASFAHRMSRRIVIVASVIIALGLASFGSGAALFFTSQRSIQSAISQHTREDAIAIPANFGSVTDLVTNASGATVTYVVSTDKPKAIVRQTVYQGDIARPSLSVSGKTARLSFTGGDANRDYCGGFCNGPSITIYGPALSSIVAEQGNLHYEGGAQALLNITGQGGTNIVMNQGQVETLNITLGDNASFDGNNASLQSVSAKPAARSRLFLGTVRSLTLDVPTACPSDSEAEIIVHDVTAGTITLGGQSTAATSRESSCSNLRVITPERS